MHRTADPRISRDMTARALAGLASLPLDRAERRTAAKLLRIQACGERIAMHGARGQAEIAPTPGARRFLRRQARQEAFHTVLFEGAATLLAGAADPEADLSMPQPLLRIQRRLSEAIERHAFLEAVTIQHIALEGLGHSVLEWLDGELAAAGDPFRRLRRLVLAQEDAHYRFGARWIAAAGDSEYLRRVMHEMMSDAEALLLSVSPLLRRLGGDCGQVLEALRESWRAVPEFARS